jgi:ribulose-phosphate 3-epimerase
MHDQLEKVSLAAEFRKKTGVEFWLQVDGGVDTETIELAADAGADTFVAGSAIYGKENPAIAIDQLRDIANQHKH